jgi:7-carboxy-7-deazaguanine synthase
MNVVEIFYSIQGEGRLAGVPSVFIRIAGCQNRCTWCDTKYAWDASAGENLSIEEILRRVGNLLPIQTASPDFIVVTGGEPMANPHLPLLLAKLAQEGRHITVETSGIAFIPDLPVNLVSISPKLSNTGRAAKSHSAVILRKLIGHYDYQLKFVIDTEDDINKVKAVLDSLKNVDYRKVMLMPQAQTRDEMLAKSQRVVQLCTQYGFTFCCRLQVMLWDSRQGR